MTTPRATYRIQLRNHGVDFAAVRRALPWLSRLGISHLYLSPILMSRSGSTHGYDGIDPRRVDPALGGEAGLRELADACVAHGMTLLVDLVPNHLAAHPENPFFADLLARGRSSAYADWFDVDWEAEKGRILLPWLPEPLRQSLANGHVRLEGCRARARLRCGALALPLADGTALSQAALHAADVERVLSRQHYVLDDWRRARRRLNYRRFFDVNELIGVRVEDPNVFEALHRTVISLVREGIVGGLRIDHVDGLADPAGYLRRLQHELKAASGTRVLLLVEKILAHGEGLPHNWPIDGTTGYEFLNGVEALFIEPEGARTLARNWARSVNARGGFREAARRGRRRVLRELLEADVHRVGRRLARQPGARGMDEASLARALTAFLVHLDVYRVYPTDRGSLAVAPRRRIESALRAAEQEGRAASAGLGVLRRILIPAAARANLGQISLARYIQQLAAATAAKGVEDTAFYTYTPLLSRNEVGSDPGRPLDQAVAEFHIANRRRAAAHPCSLSAVSTHDTKRSADVRARLDVLSEIPQAWQDAQARWLRFNAKLHERRGVRAVPDLRSELFLYQTLVGVWPLGSRGSVPSLRARRALARRLEAYVVKAAREAKRQTNWIRPDPGVEAALEAFVRSIVVPMGAARSRFLQDLSHFVREVERPGLWNSVSRTLLQAAAPGVPDVYQGDELWRFDLVDPDNRRAVDFASRAEQLDALEAEFAAGAAQRRRLLRALVRCPEDGRVKLHVLRRALAARARDPALFTSGAYRPLKVRGARAGHLVAFAREHAGQFAVVAAPRLVRSLLDDPDAPPRGAAVWGDTRIVLPRPLVGRRMVSSLTGESVRAEAELCAALLLDPLPAALLVARAPDRRAACALSAA
jgi:(1->4)-alpha-D-glucan 1-alpha-D-glucosylmutase